jgi:hypothetical protein
MGLTSASTLISILELALLSAERSSYLKDNSPALAKLREGVAVAAEELALSVQIEAGIESDGQNLNGRRQDKSQMANSIFDRKDKRRALGPL